MSKGSRRVFHGPFHVFGCSGSPRLVPSALLSGMSISLSQGEDPGEIRAKSQSGTQQDAKRGSAVKECNGEVKVLRQRE